jgi:hypothetical protein
VCLEHASESLLDLVELMGLTHVLPGTGRGVSPPRRSGRIGP